MTPCRQDVDAKASFAPEKKFLGFFFCFLFWMWDASFLVVMIYMEKKHFIKADSHQI